MYNFYIPKKKVPKRKGPSMWIIIACDSPFSGNTNFYGYFDDESTARTWAEKHVVGEHFWIVEVQSVYPDDVRGYVTEG